jgi:AcrR family transcriptional regulator
MRQKSNQKLGRQDWIDAGLRAMTDGGVDAVRVERLAAALHVTKGSFYWHFEDRGALLAALLVAWQERATSDVIAHVEKAAGAASDRLRNLFTIVAQDDGRLDQAIRAWAAQDGKVRSAQRLVDQKRLGYVDNLFCELGFAPPDATARARLVYHSLIGQFMIGTPSTRRERLAECLNIIYPMLIRKA